MAIAGLPIHELAGRVNDLHYNEGSEARRRYVTAIIMRLDARLHEAEVVNAGHNPGFLIRGDGYNAEAPIQQSAARALPLTSPLGCSYNKPMKLVRYAVFSLLMALVPTILFAQAAQTGTAQSQTSKSSKSTASASTASQQEISDAKSKGMVWVNTKTKVYHTADDRYYGTTKVLVLVGLSATR